MIAQSAKYRPRVSAAAAVGDQAQSEFHVVQFHDGTTKRFPRVTTICDVVGKSWLRTWASKVEQESVKEAVKYALLSTGLGDGPLIDREAARHMVDTLRPGYAAERLRLTAANYGTKAHQAIEDALRGGVHVVSTDPNLELTHVAWADWWKGSGLTVLEIEKKVSCIQCGYAGSLDFLARDAAGKVWVCDNKTSKRFDSSFLLQLSAYWHASPIPADGAMVVKLPRGPGRASIKTYSADELREGFTTFRAALQVWRFLRAMSNDDPGDAGLGGH